jgi:hypothetical protein
MSDIKIAAERIPGMQGGAAGGQRRRVNSGSGQRLRTNEFDPFLMFNRVWNRMMGQRDYYQVFGWDYAITPQQIYKAYVRGGIARRIVEAYPDATWAYPPDMTGVSKGFDKGWTTMVEDLDLWNVFKRWDQLSRLGRYGVLLVGTDSPNLETPLTKASKIIYLQPYSELSAQITQWETDQNSPRFGLPKTYTIYPDLLESQTRPPMLTSWGFPTRRSFKVDASRILHLAQGAMEDDVFGTPYLVPGWNYLTDIQKVVGGSAESYWLTANRGMQFDVDKDMELDDEDEGALAQEVDEYDQGLRRVVRTKGVTVRDLGSRVADPRGPFGVLLSLLAGTYGIPGRILVGSEAGHLASTQDKSAWSQQIEAYRFLTAYPKIVKAYIKFCVRIGVLQDPKDKLNPVWPDAYRASPLERAQTANQVSTAVMNIASGMAKVKNLLSVEEARNLIGTPSDDSIFIDDDSGAVSRGTPPDIVQSGGTGGTGGKTTSPGAGNTAAAGSADSNGAGDASASNGSGSKAAGSGA